MWLGIRWRPWYEWRERVDMEGLCMMTTSFLGLWYPDRAWTMVSPWSMEAAHFHENL